MFELKTLSRVLCAALVAGALAPAAAAPRSGVISAPSRVDVAYDAAHHMLFISGGPNVLRYDMDAGAFADPIVLGGTTNGLDISADGKWLAVANTSPGATKNFVDLVNLKTLKHHRVAFDLAFAEGGTYAVAWDSAGRLLVTSVFEGSGWTPLRRYDPATGATIELTQGMGLSSPAMVSPSADHSWVAITEADISDGPYGRYASGDATYSSTFNLPWFTFEIGISKDGEQMAIPTYGGTYVNDAKHVFPVVGQYAGVLPIGVAYSPVKRSVYFPFSGTNYIAEYDTHTMMETRRFTVPGTFGWVGNWAFQEGRTKVASDGSYLFSTLGSGVYFRSLKSVD